MTWVRANYDRVAVLAAALFLFASALLILRNVSQFAENFSALQAAPPPKPAMPPPKAVEMEQAMEKLRQPAQWTFSGRSGLFVPEKHFIGANGLPATLQTTEVHPPVPNEWLEQFALPIAEADVLSQDPDADGFNNQSAIGDMIAACTRLAIRKRIGPRKSTLVASGCAND